MRIFSLLERLNDSLDTTMVSTTTPHVLLPFWAIALKTRFTVLYGPFLVHNDIENLENHSGILHGF